MSARPQDVAVLEEYVHGPTFRGFGAGVGRGASLDPYINVDVFHMSAPTFRPHPHAGFSAVTYLFPESPGAFINRDSGGTHCVIGPGALHWTQAARGIVHEEVPERPGTDCWGVQMFVDLAPEHELAPPAAFHVASADVPVATAPGLVARVLAGRFGDVESPLQSLLTPVRLLDVSLDRGATFTLHGEPRERLWAIGLDGMATDGSGVHLAERSLVTRAGGAGLSLLGTAPRSRFLVGGGVPVGHQKLWAGSLAMHSRDRLEDAQRRFRAGEMGSLAPSF